MFIEQVRQLSYYANLGLFWEVMCPVFLEMSDLYDEGKMTTLRTATCYPLDDSNVENLQKNREFYEQQLDRFKRPEARLRDIQNQQYR